MFEDESIAFEVRVMIVEDHDRLCDVLQRIVSATPGLTCCGSFNSGHETLMAIPELRPDVISIDLTMPDLNGLTVLKRIRVQWPEVRCVVFSGHSDEAYVSESFAAGAMGYIYKEDVNDYIEGLRVVASGEYFLSPRVMDAVPDPTRLCSNGGETEGDAS